MGTTDRPKPSTIVVRRHLRVALIAAVAVVCAGQAWAQCDELQQELDNAPPGSVVVIQEDIFCAEPTTHLRISKPLTLRGAGSEPITVRMSNSTQFAPDTSVFYVADHVSGEVVFHNLSIQGVSFSHDGLSQGPPGVLCASPSAEVLFDSCIVRGASIPWKDGCYGRGAAGVAGTASSIAIIDSAVYGGNALVESWAFSHGNPGFGGDGGSGVDVDCEVIVVRSSLEGGFGSNTVGYVCDSGGCEIPGTPGNGGDAVAAPHIYAWDSVGSGGSPGVAWACDGQIVESGYPGNDLAPNPPARFAVANHPAIGEVVWFEYENLAADVVWLCLGLEGWSTGVEVGPGLFFALEGLAILGPFAGAASNGLAVPLQPTLIGTPIAAQSLIGTHLSNPDLFVILP